MVKDSKLLGCVTTKNIKEIAEEQRAHKTVGDVTMPCSPANTVSPGTNASELIAAMAQPGAISRYMVVENNRLVGVISLTDLREYIALKLELESAAD